MGEVSRLSQERTELENEVRIYETRIQSLEQTIRNDSISLQQYEEEIDFLRVNFEDQLKDISYLVVAMGKCSLGPNDVVQNILDNIGDKMIIKAIDDVNGSKISSIRIVQQNKMIRDYIKSVNSGHAQVVDSYTNNFSKLTETSSEDIWYLIQAVEVSPFKTESKSNTISKKVSNKPDVYLITEENLNEVWEKENLHLDFSKKPVKEFIKWMIEQEHNKKIEPKIKGIYDDYQSNISKLMNSCKNIDAKIQKHRYELVSCHRYNDG